MLKEKLEALNKLLRQDSTTLDKVEQTVVLFKGVDSRLDSKIAQILQQLSNIKNLQEGDAVELVAENLPEGTEQEKKRKKALLLLLKSAKELQSEIERIKSEVDSVKKGEQSPAQAFSKTLAVAKGPFGIVTLIAAAAVFGLFFLSRGQTKTQSSAVVSPSATPSSIIFSTPSPSVQVSPSPTSGEKIQVITYDGAKIPLSQLAVRTGPDCTNSPTEAPHYHATNGQYVIAIDGSQINDPGGCAFGKVSETQVEEVSPQDSASQGEFHQTAF